jgi:hypothetical protein
MKFTHAAQIVRVLVTMLVVASASPVFAQEVADGPTSLIITYKAKPESRAAFRAYMVEHVAQQFVQWEKDGIYRHAQLLFSGYAGGSAEDLIVILDFAHYTDLARWKDIERRLPGGLPAEALALGAPDGSALADPLAHGEATQRDVGKATYLITFYDVVTDRSRYQKYIAEYTVPQMKGWLEAGILAAYSMYVNQNPAGAPWNSMLVLEYRDQSGLAQREMVKDRVRKQLSASDAVWKAWSTDKDAVRKEKGVVLADAIVPTTMTK